MASEKKNTAKAVSAAENSKMANKMSNIDEQVLRTTKEIVVKFIEVGRVSPNTFPEIFSNIYQTIHTEVSGPLKIGARSDFGSKSDTDD